MTIAPILAGAGAVFSGWLSARCYRKSAELRGEIDTLAALAGATEHEDDPTGVSGDSVENRSAGANSLADAATKGISTSAVALSVALGMKDQGSASKELIPLRHLSYGSYSFKAWPLTPTPEPKTHSVGQSWPLVERLITGYHQQALGQASAQFQFSVAAATAGFGLLLYMILSAPDKTTLELTLRSLPAVVIEAVAALFFKQAAETRQRATELYDRLRSDQQRADAVRIVESIEDDQLRSVVKAQLALHAAGLTSSSLDFAPLLPQMPNDASGSRGQERQGEGVPRN